MIILLVEDDEAIARGLEYSLQQEGFGFLHCSTLAAARHALANERPALVLLDIGLPDGSGYELCSAAKAQGASVIFLTACDDEGNVVMGLDMGADDYITKPFRVRELLSRIRAVLRRGQGAAEVPLQVLGGVTVNLQKAQVSRVGVPVGLTALEYKLLLTLLAHPGQILTRAQLLEGIWDVAGNFVNDNTLSVYIKRLREKLEEPGGPRLIATVRGIGYRLEADYAEE